MTKLHIRNENMPGMFSLCGNKPIEKGYSIIDCTCQMCLKIAIKNSELKMEQAKVRLIHIKEGRI